MFFYIYYIVQTIVRLRYIIVKKASYFYVEFVTQISTDETLFLQLSSRDATNYVYKKTIFEMKHPKNQEESYSEESAEKIKCIELYLNGYKLFL